MSVLPNQPLEPDSRALLEHLRKLNMPAYETMSAQDAREVSARIRANADIPHVRVAKVEDFEIDHDGHRMVARRYTPFNSVSPRPTLIYMHGGGWTIGTLETLDHLCRTLTPSCGIEVISLDYPLSPEARFPEPLEACAAAVRWIFENASVMGIDTSRVAIGGDSAGGNLAAALSLMSRDGDLPAFKAQCLIYPALDLTCAHPSFDLPDDVLFLRASTYKWFLGHYLSDPDQAHDWRASPLLVDEVNGVAPAYVLTADYDFLVDEAVAYAQRLTNAGVPVWHKSFGGQLHNFVAMPHYLPTAHIAIADIAEFLMEALWGQTSL